MFTQRAACILRFVPLCAVLVLLQACSGTAQTAANLGQFYQYEDTRELMALVKDATELVRTKGEAGTGDVVEAVRHARAYHRADAPPADRSGDRRARRAVLRRHPPGR